MTKDDLTFKLAVIKAYLTGEGGISNDETFIVTHHFS